MEPNSSARLVPPKINTSGPRELPLRDADARGPSTLYGPTSAPPPVRVSTSTNNFSEPGTSNATPANPSSRAKNESRKLLTHVLYQLLNRKRPPPIAQTIADFSHGATESGSGALADLMRGVASIRKSVSKDPSRAGEADDNDGSDGEQAGTFSTEATYELMTQLQDLLSMSLSLRWQLFEDSSDAAEEQPKERGRSSRFRRSKIPSRSPSPNHATPQKLDIPHLLSLCISILSSIVSEDCRFQIISHRPSRPPNSLQIATLNVAQFLINAHLHDPKVVSQVGFAIIPAFSTFPREMQGRLMMFFQDVVIRGLLETLSRSQRLAEYDNNSVMSPVVGGRVNQGPVVQIQIEEVQSDVVPEGIRNLVKIQSTNAPHQSPHVYYLASLVAPLLAAVLEAVDATSLQPTHELAVRFYGLLEIVASLKVDAYNDLLQICAYHTTQSRKSACALLSTLWPKIIGHATISHSLSIPLSLDYRKATIPWVAHRGHTHHHQFIPWQFTQKSSWSNFHGIPQHSCSLCSVGIDGFGVLCPFCMCAVHWDCYEPPDGTLIQHYTMGQDASAQRVALLRISPVIPSGGEPSFQYNRHNFELVTIFTLCLCYLCHQPLWGCVAQGAKCSTCSYIAHTSCLLSPSMPLCGQFQLDSERMTISHRALRRAALDRFPELQWTDDQLGILSYEEVLIIHDNLRTQLQLILNGIDGSSIIVTQQGGVFKAATSAKDIVLEDFELHATLDYCKRLLASPASQKSAATLDYMEENRVGSSEHSILYDFSTLAYLSTAMKSPISMVQPATPSPFSDLLNVDSRDPFEVEPPAVESVAHPYEAVPLSHMRDILNVEFNLRHPVITQILLNHLFHLSFFERLDPRQNITFDPVSDDALCVFPLPLGLDMSTDVETLVASIEACLLDLDLSVNEFGFLLVVRKFWPNGLMSEYGLRRLARGILSWIIAEDDNLATIIRDYVAKQQPLPGVRSNGDTPPWPFSHPVRGDPQASNGRDYMTARTALLTRYSLPWLLSLHNQDREAYTNILYDTCVELAEDRVVGSEVFDENIEDSEANSIKRLDAILFAIIKILHASVTFSCSEELILRWLRLVSDLGIPSKSISGLGRLFPRDTDSMSRSSSIDPDTPKAANKESAPIRVESLDILLKVARFSSSSLSQALDWLVMIASSGVDIPISIFDKFTSLVATEEATLRQVHSLVHAMTVSLWLRSIGRQYFQTLLGRLHSVIAPKVVKNLKGTDFDARGSSLVIIRHSLAACLLVYGCERLSLIASGLIEEAEVKNLPSRRKLGSRVQAVDDPIMVNAGILQGIAQYLRLDEWQSVTCWIAKFLHMFFTASPLIPSYEVDNFIFKNGPLLAECAWKFYGIQRDDIAAIRTHFLLRTIVVESEPFQNLIDGGLNPDLHWERRLVTMHRMSRIVMDVTSPAFNIDGRQWRSGVGAVFASFFSMLWKDAQEEIRLAVRVVTQGLMPAQIEAISQCWNETLSTSPMVDKIRLISFLIHLRPHLPGWQVISWDNLIEAMEEYDEKDPDISGFYSAYSNQGELDTVHLLSSSLILGLSMIADGVTIEPITLLRIKVHVVRLFSFSNLSSTPSSDGSALYIQYGSAKDIPEISYPCLDALVSVVDAPHTVEMPAWAWGAYQEGESRFVPLLVGYIFVDVILSLLSGVDELDSLPVLPLKRLLEATYIILHKVDFDVSPARALQPVLRQAMDCIIELVPKNINYEVRQLALTVIQAFCRRCFAMIRVGQTVFTILENVTEVAVSLNQHSQDSLVIQGKGLIQNLLSEHTNDGLMINIFKRQLKPTFFAVLKQVLEVQRTSGKPDPDPLVSYLWRDALSRAPETDPTSMQLVIENMAEFVDIVYHSEYSYEVITYTGQQVAAIMRRLSDNLFDAVDCSLLLSMLARLSKYNRKHSRELLPYIETTLRVALTRGSITAPCLIELITATQPKVLDSSTPLGKVLSTLVEILSDSLRLKARVLPTTLKAIIESLTSEEIPVYQDDPQMRFRVLMANLVENGCYFLDHHTWLDQHTENDFNVSLTVAKIVFQALEEDPTATDSSIEINYKIVNSLRSWIVLAIAVLQEDAPKGWVAILFRHFQSFSSTYLSTMRTYAQSNLSLDSAASDINYAYIATKSWLMVAQRMSNTTRAGDVPMLRVWNEVWPAFESVVDALEVEARAGLSSTLLVLASATIADLLIFLRNLRTPLALDIASHMDILGRLKAARGEVENAKVTRAFQAMSGAPADINGEHMLEQIAKETIAAEKMKNLEAKRDVGRVGDSRWLPR